MLKTRVKKWGLDKKHKKGDMRTAVALIARDRARWSSRHPTFRIRNQTVTYQEILAYFRRQRITDPVAWVQQQQGDGFVASPEVELIIPDVDEGYDNTSPRQSSASTSGQAAGQSLASSWTSSEEVRRTSLELINSPKKTPPATLQGSSIIHPYQHLPGDKVIWVMREYCDSYLESPRAARHKEPPVHRSTTHASFAYSMQTGMFQWKRGEVKKAFEVFGGAFEFLKDMFRDHHPMGIAMLMSTICELKKNNLPDIVTQLTSYTRALVETQHKDSHQLTALFGELDAAGADTANLAVSSMHVALDNLSQKNRELDWKTLYLKERLCDSLYYLGWSGEGAALRAELLEQQEQKYGKNVRNVLWTLTNVADDDLLRGELQKAEERFLDALDRANTLDGYERANGRFKALEGLAKTAVARANLLMPVSTFDGFNTVVSDPHRRPRHEKLRAALRFYEDAETEAAMPWFEGPRRARVVENRMAVKQRIDSERRNNSVASIARSDTMDSTS
jgi:hypothetical protein